MFLVVFRSKVDAAFITFISICIIVIALVTIFPMFLEDGNELSVVLILLSIFIISSGLILWVSFGIIYVFYDEYLFIKGGFFRSKIPYDKITKVSPSSNMLVGYRILSSSDGLEIFYQTALLGSVKISPNEEELFIAELEKRCSNLQVATDLQK